MANQEELLKWHSSLLRRASVSCKAEMLEAVALARSTLLLSSEKSSSDQVRESLPPTSKFLKCETPVLRMDKVDINIHQKRKDHEHAHGARAPSTVDQARRLRKAEDDAQAASWVGQRLQTENKRLRKELSLVEIKHGTIEREMELRLEKASQAHTDDRNAYELKLAQCKAQAKAEASLHVHNCRKLNLEVEAARDDNEKLNEEVVCIRKQFQRYQQQHEKQCQGHREIVEALQDQAHEKNVLMQQKQREWIEQVSQIQTERLMAISELQRFRSAQIQAETQRIQTDGETFRRTEAKIIQIIEMQKSVDHQHTQSKMDIQTRLQRMELAIEGAVQEAELWKLRMYSQQGREQTGTLGCLNCSIMGRDLNIAMETLMNIRQSLHPQIGKLSKNQT